MRSLISSFCNGSKIIGDTGGRRVRGGPNARGTVPARREGDSPRVPRVRVPLGKKGGGFLSWSGELPLFDFSPWP